MYYRGCETGNLVISFVTTWDVNATAVLSVCEAIFPVCSALITHLLHVELKNKGSFRVEKKGGRFRG